MASEGKSVRDANDDRSLLGIASLLGSVGLGVGAVLAGVGAGGLAGTAVAATVGGVVPVVVKSAVAWYTARRYLAALRAEGVTSKQRETILEDLARRDPRVVKEAIRQIDANDPARETLTRLSEWREDTPPPTVERPTDVDEPTQEGAGRAVAAIYDSLSQGIGVAVLSDPSADESNAIIIPSGARLPCRKSVLLSTATPHQSVISVKLTLGDSEDLAECLILADLSYPIKPRAEAASIELELSVAANDFLQVEVRTSVDGEVLGTAQVEYPRASEDNPDLHDREGAVRLAD